MKKVFEIIRFEYLTQVKRKGFWIGVFSIPLLIILSIGISIFSLVLTIDQKPVAYIDRDGVLEERLIPPEEGPFNDRIEFVAYEDVDQAREDLLNEKIQGYFVIDENYQLNRKVEYFTPDLSYDKVVSDFRRHLRFNLLRDIPENTKTRIWDGSSITIRSLQTMDDLNLDQWWNIALPFVVAVILFILIQMGGSYILQAMVTEKETRMMEILVTAVTPLELLIGKAVGNLAVAITMLLVWGLFGGVLLVLLPAFTLIQLDINWGIQILTLILFLETLFMYAGFMLTAGLLATDAREAGQLTWGFSLLMSLPFVFITGVLFNPNNALSVFLSLFPFTSFFVMPVRMSFGSVPTWQILLSGLILCGMMAFSGWLASRALKSGLLNFSRKLKYRDLFKKGNAS